MTFIVLVHGIVVHSKDTHNESWWQHGIESQSHMRQAIGIYWCQWRVGIVSDLYLENRWFILHVSAHINEKIFFMCM
jgi:hypothetical protein